MADPETAPETVRVTCANLFHQGALGVDFEQEGGVAAATATPEKARALLEKDPEGYRCPELEDEQASGKEAPSDEKPPSGEETPDPETRGQAMARLTAIGGVGPSYARKLVRAGIETKGALKAAVPADLEERTGIGAGRIEDWQAGL